MKRISDCMKSMEGKSTLQSSTQSSEKLREEKVNSEMVVLTDWLLKKLQALFAGKMYKGTTTESVKELKLAWQDVLQAMGKETVLATYKFLKTAHEDVPKFAPSPIEFKQIAQVHVMPFIKYKNKFKLLKFEKTKRADESIVREHLDSLKNRLKDGEIKGE